MRLQAPLEGMPLGRLRCFGEDGGPMRLAWRNRLLFIVGAVLCVSGASAGYDEGVAAHKRGDYAAALREFQPGANAGEALSQRGLGYLFESGQGVPKDVARALSWYRKAAAQGDAYSQYRIGWIYENGLGVARNVAEAVGWYRQAAANGDPEAQSQLGWLLLSGNGVARDVKQGSDWIRKAAAQGNAVAQGNMGWIHLEGLGVPADPRIAAQWYRKSAEQGVAFAQRTLALMLLNGRGVATDVAQGMDWMSKAAEQGDAQAREALASMQGAGQAAASGEARPPGQTQPSGSLSLLCSMQSGQSYVFVINERAQQVSVRDSTGQDWVTFKNGQTTRQRMGDQALSMIDSVRVDATAIRALREPRDDSTSASPKVSSNQQTNELLGLLGALATSSAVVIDRNSGIIRTGGMGMFPNNGAGNCQPWSGRRF